MLKRLLLIVIICIYSVNIALSIGVGVAPANMTFNSYVGLGNSQSLFVKNDGSETANYRLYVDDDYVNWFSITPNNFTLSAGDYKEVEVTVKPPITASGDFDMKAYVVATSLSSDFEVGSGIKIPVHINVSNTSLYIALAAAILLVAVITARIARNRKGSDEEQNEQTAGK